MRKVLGLVLVVLFGFTISAHAAESDNKGFYKKQRDNVKEYVDDRKQDNKQMAESLKGKTAEEKVTEWKEYKTKQNEANAKFKNSIHQENMKYLKERLAINKNLTDQQKVELSELFEKQYEERIVLRATQQDENVIFFEKVANEDTMTIEQKKEAIKAHFVEQKDAAQALLNRQKEIFKEESNKIKGENKLDTTNTLEKK
ncbi:MAG: hypothetical protein HQL25_07755 [Candidatus Omnitrophica bacterium]|nr:hypothetical protein [Candidatus Omnitrophota bacterium]